MSKITELRKYKESKEFQKIIDKCKNRQENLETQILQAFPKVDNEQVLSNHDVNYQRMQFWIDRLEEIKSKSEWASILIEDINEEIERAKTFLTLGIRDQYGITNSSPIFNTLDLTRCLAQDNRYFQTRIDWMIAALEKEEEKEEPTYEEAPTED